MRAFRLAYDGTRFRGFQRQPHGRTVENTLFEALVALDVLDPDAAKPDGYAAAGRTDRGVSALAQTVAFGAPDWLGPRALNGRLPDSVRAWAHADPDGEFHARHDATERRYTYHLHAPAASVDDERARAACEALTGEHDFHNLTPDTEGTVRDLSVSLERDTRYLVFDLRAPGFARQLVRRVVALVDVIARRERDLAFVERVLDTEPIDGAAGVAPAPPEGLLLRDVSYPDVSFTVDPEAAADARAVFDTRRVDAATRARTFGSVADSL